MKLKFVGSFKNSLKFVNFVKFLKFVKCEFSIYG